MNSKYFYACAALLLGLTACSNEDFLTDTDNVSASGHPVTLTITVNRGGTMTRTLLEENPATGGLTDKWELDDVLYVYDASGDEVGQLELKETIAPSVGIFSGLVDLEQGEQELSLWYYNTNDNVKVAKSSDKNVLKIDLHTQEYADLEALSAMDVLSKKVAINVNGTESTVVQSETLDANLAFARFSLTGIPEGTKGNLKIYDTNNISVNKGVIQYTTVNSLNLNLGNPAQNTAGTSDNSDIVVKNVEVGKDVYVALIPYNENKEGYRLGFTFTAENGDVYTYAFKNGTVIESGVYYCAFTKYDNEENGEIGGIELPMLVSSNPGLMDNWGGATSLIPPSYTDTKEVKAKYSGGGWCYNQYSIHTGDAWCDPMIYHSNGMVNGAMYSTREASPSYYQWGRWMGIPYNANMLKINSYGQPINTYTYWAMDNAFALGGSIKDNVHVKYQNTQYGSVYGGYFTIMKTTAWISGGWTNDQAKKFSIVFGSAASQGNDYLDYIKSSDPLAGVCSWEDRSGNPCPDGWRVPTFAELKNVFPGGLNGGSVDGSLAEVRIINGQKVAFCYKVTTNSSGIPCVNIYSVPTTKSSVTVNDPVFDGATMLSIGAYGFIGYDGGMNKYKTQAWIWSADSYQNSYGVGGTCMIVEFNGTKATFKGSYQDRIYGCNIIPIRDANAKHTDLRPWFPYSEL